MATVEFWIQIENNPWMSRRATIDRLTGRPCSRSPGKRRS